MNKKTVSLLFYLFALLPFLTACSEISENERLVEVQPDIAPQPDEPEPEDSAAIDSLYEAPVEAVARRILIEDHTGQKCPNCPDATDITHQLAELYGNLIIPVAIHSKDLGIREPEGLGNELGNTYYAHWNITSKPAGLISRMDGGAGVVMDKTLWAMATQYILQQPTSLDIRIKAAQQKDDATHAAIDVKVICTDSAGAAVNGKLQVWLTEDSIVAEQDFPNGQHQADYVHNHVLRTAVNGTWGEDVSVSGFADTREFHYDAPLAAGWKPGNLAVVAFVYNDEQVVQVARRKLNVEK